MVGAAGRVGMPWFNPWRRALFQLGDNGVGYLLIDWIAHFVVPFLTVWFDTAGGNASAHNRAY
jgi:hypothetical protein